MAMSQWFPERRNRKVTKGSWADISDAQPQSMGAGDEVEALMRLAGCSEDSFDKLQNGTATPKERAPPVLQQLLGTLPSPARGGASRAHLGVAQTSAAPCSPPAYAPVQLSAASSPPPPSWSSARAPAYQASAYQAPAPTYQALEPQWQAPRSAAPVLPEPAFASYREKLRAGGRGAFERANHAGFGKPVMQEWNTPTPAQGQGIPPQWPEDQYNMAMQYAGDGDINQMWSSAGQMQSNTCWGVPVDPPSMAPQYPYAQQPHQFQQTMLLQDLTQMSPMAGQQSPQAFMQQSRMPSIMSEMAMQKQQHMQMAPSMAEHQQMAPSPTPSSTSGSGTFPNAFSTMPQMAPSPTSGSGTFPNAFSTMPQMAPSPTSGTGGPVDIDRCMAIVMPGAGYSHVSADLVAAQLQALAETQGCYED